MTTGYTFPLATPGAGGNGVAARTFALRYAFTPERDDSGDLIIDGSDMRAGVPCVEIVRNVLATQKGSFAGDPDLGPDYRIIATATGNVVNDWIAEVKRSLKFLTEAKTITSVVITADVSQTRRALLYQVEFVDPVSGLIHRVRGLVGL
jgi:hypothetical protein